MNFKRLRRKRRRQGDWDRRSRGWKYESFVGPITNSQKFVSHRNRSRLAAALADTEIEEEP